MEHLYLYLLGFQNGIRQLQDATLPQNTFPQLNSNYAENEKDKETQKQNVSQHRQSVQQQHHQDSHT